MIPSWTEIAVSLLIAGFAGVSAGHALLRKRDPRAALGWVAICVVFPLFGPLSYFLFGVNRVATRARELKGRLPAGDRPAPLPAGREPHPEAPATLSELVRVGDAVTARPLLAGNRVAALYNGEQAYPAMLAAIAGARRSIRLATYIFDTDATGERFLTALREAADRGVAVAVLVDGVGELYSHPRASRRLRRLGIPCARFVPPRLIPPALHINLRTHRKILVVDGRVAFTGGMNIGDRQLVGSAGGGGADIHFRLSGPIVEQIGEVFEEDWRFVTGAASGASAVAAAPEGEGEEEAGDALCRTVVDGPNEDLDKLVMLLVGAVSSARERVWIMTPYLLPPRELTAALQAAALRGVDVKILLPGENNLPFVHWATRNMLWELLQRGVEVSYQPPPFVHSKLFLVDSHYAQIGSANLDPRSLRLNFELNVEVYDQRLSADLERHFYDALARSRRVTLEEVDGRPLWQRLRDAAAWLFTPYL